MNDRDETALQNTAEVWLNGEFLGRVGIWEADWQGTRQNWRAAAHNAARRVYGDGKPYHVVEKSHVMGERL